MVLSTSAVSGEHTSDSTRPHDLPAVISVFPAAILYPITILALWLHRPAYHAIMDKRGAAESVTMLALAIGIGIGFVALRHAARLPRNSAWVHGWIVCVMLGMFFILGEEAAWGQELDLWTREALPAWLRAVNDQQKSTLHNMRHFPETAIRNLMILAILIGCLILPAIRAWKKKVLPVDGAGYWFWPTTACVPAAIGVVIIPWPRHIANWIIGEKLEYLRHTEMLEAYIALLLMIYIASIAWRIRQLPSGRAAA